MTITPAANQSGTATITVTVTDGDGGTASDTFVLTVTAVNDAADDLRHHGQDDDRGHARPGRSASRSATCETAAASLTVTASSSNTDAGPDGQHRVRRQRREPDRDDHAGGRIRAGTATITVTVTDGDGGTASDTFVLTVTAVNDLPTISDITDKTTNEDTATAALSFTVGDTRDGGGVADDVGELVEHDAGAGGQHRVRRQRREPDGHDHAGGAIRPAPPPSR